MSSFAPKIKRYTPATGATIQMEDSDGDMVVILAPAAAIAALTLNWPATPFNGQKITVVTTQDITLITHSGATLNQNVTTLKATGSFTFVYDSGGPSYMSAGVQNMSNMVTLTFSATVAGGAGNAVCYATDSGLIGGVGLFAYVDDAWGRYLIANPDYAVQDPVVTNSNKTVTTYVATRTVPILTVLGLNVSGVATLTAAVNGTVIKVSVRGRLA